MSVTIPVTFTSTMCITVIVIITLTLAVNMTVPMTVTVKFMLGAIHKLCNRDRGVSQNIIFKQGGRGVRLKYYGNMGRGGEKDVMKCTNIIFFYIDKSSYSSANFFYSIPFLPIKSEIINRFRFLICLNDYINLPNMIE